MKIASKSLTMLFVIFAVFFPVMTTGQEEATPTRFINNRDGTVTDTKTKLMWQKGDNSAMVTFQAAQAYCKSLKFAGYTDWRLPKKDEKDEAVVVQLMMPRHSKEMPADFYWSDDPTVKLAFNFLTSHVSVFNIYGAKEGSRAYVRAVRGISAGTPKQKEGETGETASLISAKISELRQGMFSFFKACSVTPYHNFMEENVNVPAGTPEDDLVGIAVTFQEDWGGWGSEEEVTKEETVLFRKGMVGKCKAIPSYVKDGTEAKVKGCTYIFKNGKWQVSQ